MSDLSIRKDFVDGVYEIFSTIFNEAKTPDDGVQYFAFSGGESNIYNERKFKKYKAPIILVAKVQETVTEGSEDIKAQKRSAIFTVPVKSLTDNGIEEMNKSVIQDMKKGLIKYNDVLYKIDSIQGSAFVENVYLLWQFNCTEIFDPDSLQIEIEEEPENFNFTVSEEEDS